MSEEPVGRRPLSEAEKYQTALRRIAALKEKHPELHEAVLTIVGKHVGDCVKGFFTTDFDPRAAANIHARFTDLDKVARILSDPASYLKKEQEALSPPSAGGLRGGIAALFAIGRKAKETVTGARMQEPKEGAS